LRASKAYSLEENTGVCTLLVEGGPSIGFDCGIAAMIVRIAEWVSEKWQRPQVRLKLEHPNSREIASFLIIQGQTSLLRNHPAEFQGCIR